MKRKYIIYLISSILFFLYLFVVYNVNFRGPDEPIYFAYTASVVEDRDLNIVNQVYTKSASFSTSRTYNLPDFHNHGGVILWVPFYVYGKSIYTIASKLNLTSFIRDGLKRTINCAMSFSTIVFSFMTLLLTYFFCRAFFSNRNSFWSTSVLFLGTPFFYYTLFEPGNANMIASLFSILLIWFCSYVLSMKKSHWFLYGLFFSICVTIKTELMFQIIFILSFFTVLVVLKKTDWIKGVYFIIGFVPGFIMKIINDYIKYGTLHIGELGVWNFRDFYFFEQLFSSYRGFFYTSPVLYICLLGFILITINLFKNIKSTDEKKMQDFFFFILGSYMFIKIFILSFRYAWGGGTSGARILLTEFPIFVLLYARTLQTQRRVLIYLLVITSAVFVLWNLLVVYEYMKGIDLKYIVKVPSLNIRIKTIKDALGSLIYIRDLDLKLRFCLPLLLAAFTITFYIVRTIRPILPSFWYDKNQNKHKPFKQFALFTVYLCTSYMALTALNIYNNQRNVEKLKQDNFFENAEIIGPKEFEKQENVSSIDEMIEYYTLKGNIERVNKIKRLKKELYDE